MDGLALTIGSGAIGAICGVIGSWIKARYSKTTIAPNPLCVEESAYQQRVKDCKDIHCNLQTRLPDLLPDDPEMAAILETELATTFADTLAEKSDESRSRGASLPPDPIANSECRAKDPRTCSTHGDQREPETKSKRDNHGTHDEAKLIDNPDLNKKRGLSVVTHLLAQKKGFEEKALYRKDTGWIGIDYGTPGNPDNDYKGGHGLAHILAKHPEVKDSLVDTLASGECYKHHESNNKLYRVKDNYLAVLTKHRTGRLLITDFYEETPERMASRLARGKYHAKGEN